MSSEQPFDSNTIIQLHESIRILNYCTDAMYALLWYEHITTLRLEVELFWRRKLSGASVLFFCNRFLVLATYTMNVLPYLPKSDEVRTEHPAPPAILLTVNLQGCARMVKAAYTINILLYLPWAVFSGLRTLALSRSSFLALFIFVLSVVPIGANFGGISLGLTGMYEPLFGCSVIAPISASLSRKVLLVLNTAHLLFTLLSLLVFKIANVVSEKTSYVTNFTGPITSVLMSRFLIHLQAAHRDAMNGGLESLDARQSESVAFERVLGSISCSTPPLNLEEAADASEVVELAAYSGRPDSNTLGGGGCGRPLELLNS
ncbi:hypothetical protein C8Q80DRAFT_1275621 [Daedaleopsis nitida]|nr:hypothetical protein C8Q80DRAFT_1275621 [Daedaleopsis nitida]